MTTHDELLARLPEAAPPAMTPAAPRTLAELHAEQQALYDVERQREQAERAKYPDAQWDGPGLRMPEAEHDPSPAAQQDFANRYRAEHLDADVLRHRDPTDRNPITDLSDALFAWRTEQASAAWRRAASWWTVTPPCAVCGEPSEGQTVDIGEQSRYACARCRPSIHDAIAAKAAEERIGDGGRTRAQTAHDLVASLLASEQKAS